MSAGSDGSVATFKTQTGHCMQHPHNAQAAKSKRLSRGDPAAVDLAEMIDVELHYCPGTGDKSEGIRG
jgi:hypothetical protein